LRMDSWVFLKELMVEKLKNLKSWL
jgi:hypothetical protein